MAARDDGSATRRVVICGGGIIGCSTAYYLAQLGVPSIVVEREAVAAAASGKAGGFLALDWNDGSPVGPLARHSYQLHTKLAEVFGRQAIGYREVDTVQVVGHAVPSRGRARRSRMATQLPAWLDGNITACSRLGSKSTTAQVHPGKLTEALMAAAEQAGAKLLLGTVTGITTDAAAVTGVQVQVQQQQGGSSGDVVQLPADVVVLAMGAWTGVARAWLPAAPTTSGQKYHSVVLRTVGQQATTDTCVFTSFKTADGRSVEPEVYPRPDGSTYVCGEPQSLPVPEGGPAAVNVEPARCQVLQGVAGSLATGLANAAVEVQQSCYLPLSADGLPVIGRLPGTAGAYVATGHSCWGILNGPATGQALAELIVHGAASSVDIAALDPSRVCSNSRR